MKVSESEIKQCALEDGSLGTATRTFQEAGYLVLEDIYKPQWIESLRVAYDALIARYLDDKGGIGALEGTTFGKNHVGIHPALTPLWADPQLISHPIVDQVLSELLGSDYRSGYYHSNAAYPGSGVQPVHRDDGALFSGAEMNVPHPAVNIVLNIPLCDFTEENGSTEVWPGSHLIVDRNPQARKDLETRATVLPSQRTNLRAGALILRDLRMFHRGMPNQSDRVRTMLAIVYVRSWRATDVLDVPQATWDLWPERTRRIFRGSHVVPDASDAAPYRLTKTSQ